MNKTNLTILIPVRNETLNLRVMLKILRAIIDIPYEILVIFDSYQDQSVEVIQEFNSTYPNIKPVFNDIGHGVANALRSGVKAAQGENILIFAADEVGPVLAIDDMLNLMNQGCSFISCTRYAYGGRRLGGSTIGHFLSATANCLLRFVSSASFTDSTTGIKMFKKNDFDRLVHDSNSVGWAVAFEMAVNAQILNLKLGEVPIISIDRLFGGQSSFRILPWIRSYLNYFILATKKLPIWRKRAQVTIRIPQGMNNN
jgi:dolichol-phosphate mannosyltransferase